ncbi:unnamed protein product [Parascedosporium putredinis]|uniref:SMP-30/Gluconolactonase/LRE-like region domain-containing protein n=1 Tax=Parascedosporium putredinis TaxID=1442378 RepID=A0A9P1H8F6_9PEZI|nr:unnamed protein product [Parascedosporium putredinis]CAI8000710.1 unnamed protein product [Parascedosporium putredinis]
MTASNFEVWTVEEPYVDCHCKLGEGPLRKGDQHTIQLDRPVTVTADIEGVNPAEKILIGIKYGLAVLDRKTGTYEYVAKLTESPNERVRTNDGGADIKGRFWLGTMTDFNLGEFQPEGGLFRFDSSGSSELIKELTIPNSVGCEIFAFDYDVETGEISNKRLFYKHEGSGGPDGFRVDVNGFIWHAVYGESRVLKINPEGKLVGEVRLPTRNITCTQFVGTELYITTANDDEAEGGERSKNLGGGLFKVDVGVEGLPLFPYKLQV